jgi:hypothetical protein
MWPFLPMLILVIPSLLDIMILCRISGVDGSDCGRMNSRINGAMQ